MTYKSKISNCSFLFICICISTTFLSNPTVNSQPLDLTKPDRTLMSGMEECISLTDPNGWSVDIWEPGRYCIRQDLEQHWPLVRFPHQQLPRSPLISIYRSNVIVDLQQHRLVSTKPMDSGVYTAFSGNENLKPTVIKNGQITTEEIPAIFMVDMWNLGNKRFGRSYSLSSSNGNISKYKPTVFILENLVIRSKNHSIIMQGKKNIIKNCVIIGGNGTVNIYGPNLLFEGNTVFLEATAPQTSNDERPVALYLEDAAESIIRNNKIVIRGPKTLNSSAIVLTNSTDVVIEHNTIIGTKEVYKQLDERSSVRAIGNTSQ